MSAPRNIYSGLREAPGPEHFLTLFESAGIRIERIISRSHASPPGFWYDQDGDEWVIVLSGEAVLRFDDGDSVEMRTGDHLLVPKHRKHRVERTSEETVWLAVHVKGDCSKEQGRHRPLTERTTPPGEGTPVPWR